MAITEYTPEQLVSEIQRLQTELQSKEAVLASTQTQVELAKLASSDPKPDHVDTFSGTDKTLTRGWLDQLEIFFSLQPYRYATPKNKIDYAASRLRGDALAWFSPFVAQPASGLRNDYSAFTSQLLNIFADKNEVFNKQNELRRLRQTGSCAAYSGKFNHLSRLLGWNEPALIAQFYEGLKDSIKSSLANRSDKVPTTLEEYMALCGTIDDQQDAFAREQRAAQSLRRSAPPHQAPQQNTASHAAAMLPRQGTVSQPASSSGPVPMDVDALSAQLSQLSLQVAALTAQKPRGGRLPLTSAEREHLRLNAGCYYCRRINAGHVASTCPSKPQARVSAAEVAGYVHKILPTSPTSTTSPEPPKAMEVVKVEEVAKSSEQKSPINEILPALPVNFPRMLFSGKLSSLTDPRQGTPVSFLVDSGCSGLIVSQALVQRLGLPTVTTDSPLTVTFADGSSKLTSTLTQLVLIKGSYTVPLEAYVTDVTEDLILGIPWFQSIQLHLNWKDGLLRFRTLTNYSTLYTWTQDTVLNPRSSQGQRRARCYQVSAKRWQDHSRNAVMEGEILVRELLASKLATVDASAELSPEHLATMSPILQPVLREFSSVFNKPQQLPPDRPETHKINLSPDAKVPPWRGIGKLTSVQLDELKRQIEDLVDKGFIRPSTSPFGASILFATKADGSLRLCIDYRSLNAITIKDATPLPNISELRDRLGKAVVFSVGDCRDGFWNILVHPDDVHKTAFRCRYGHFEWLVLPFGLTNSPATMQRLMNRVFGDLYDDYVLVYMDDILIYSDSIETHVEHIREVLKRLHDNRLYLKLSKCKFLQKEVKFCGHLVSANGIRIDPDKLQGLTDLLTPLTSKKQVQSFIGLCNWFRDFVPCFADVSKPLSDLTKKAATWQWTPLEHMSLVTLVHYIRSAPCLKYHDPSQPTYIFTDASEFAVGGWIGQRFEDGLHPLVFWSRKLSDAEVKYPVHERECLALHDLCDRHRTYLLGNRVYAYTDHHSLVHLASQPKLNARQVRWVDFLQEFDLHVEYLPGKFNSVADILSRSARYLPLCGHCRKSLASPEVSVQACSITDKPLDIAAAVAIAQQTTPTDKLLSTLPTKHGLAYHRNVIYVPDVQSLRCTVLEHFHDPPIRGHPGAHRLSQLVRQQFSWPQLEVDAGRFVSSCDSCQRNKHPVGASPGMLEPLPAPLDRFSAVTMDPFFLPAAPTGEDMVLLVAEAGVTRNIVLIPAQSTDDALQLSKKFMDYWVYRGFGLPSTITTDRDSRFTSKFWSQFTANINSTHRCSTARHQQSDGLSERHVRTVKEALKHYLPSTKNWTELLPAIEFALNNAEASSTGFSPFYIMFGQHPRIKNSLKSHREIMAALDQALKRAHSQLVKHKEYQSIQYDKRHVLPPEYEPHQLVLLSSSNIRPKTQSKLSPLWMGPFPVAKVHSPLNVELALPPSWKVHPVFHVSQLKPYTSPIASFPSRSPISLQPFPVLVTDDNGDIAVEWLVDRIIEHRIVDKGLEFLTKWTGFSDNDNTWEPLDSFISPYTQSLLDYLSSLPPSARRAVRRHWPSSVKKPKELVQP